MTHEEVFKAVGYPRPKYVKALWAVVPDSEYLVRVITLSTWHHRFFRVAANGSVSAVATTTSGLVVQSKVPEFYRAALRLLLEDRKTSFKDLVALYDADVALTLNALAKPKLKAPRHTRPQTRRPSGAASSTPNTW